ncbi:hypothetical protein [Bradyrhizobium sp. SZCCHNR3118]|uniref:hypothetical protein n=1 Tax=Bradyrhizobium sp. SZCCHNR3118 TaxID=3057468 RepID=UPI002915EF42|nr:hypothetical protein [Bradyrhizobium sp. SZCCHNR3118]
MALEHSEPTLGYRFERVVVVPPMIRRMVTLQQYADFMEACEAWAMRVPPGGTFTII